MKKIIIRGLTDSVINLNQLGKVLHGQIEMGLEIENPEQEQELRALERQGLIEVAGVIGKVVVEEGSVYLLHHNIEAEVGVVHPDIGERSAGAGDAHLLVELVGQDFPQESGVRKAVGEVELLHTIDVTGRVEEVDVYLQLELDRAA